MTTTHQQILALLHERWPGEVPKTVDGMVPRPIGTAPRTRGGVQA